MTKYLAATALTLLSQVVLAAPAADAATPIQIGHTRSEINERGGCTFYRPGPAGPVLVRSKYTIAYQESGGPILLTTQDQSDINNLKDLAAMSINGKEILLEGSMVAHIPCSGAGRDQPKLCSRQEFVHQGIRVTVKLLTVQSACRHLPDSACASSAVSALVTVGIAPSKTSFTVVGSCGG